MGSHGHWLCKGWSSSQYWKDCLVVSSSVPIVKHVKLITFVRLSTFEPVQASCKTPAIPIPAWRTKRNPAARPVSSTWQQTKQSRSSSSAATELKEISSNLGRVLNHVPNHPWCWHIHIYIPDIYIYIIIYTYIYIYIYIYILLNAEITMDAMGRCIMGSESIHFVNPRPSVSLGIQWETRRHKASRGVPSARGWHPGHKWRQAMYMSIFPNPLEQIDASNLVVTPGFYGFGTFW